MLITFTGKGCENCPFFGGLDLARDLDEFPGICNLNGKDSNSGRLVVGPITRKTERPYLCPFVKDTMEQIEVYPLE